MCIKLLQNQTKKYTHEVHASNTCRDKYLIQWMDFNNSQAWYMYFYNCTINKQLILSIN